MKTILSVLLFIATALGFSQEIITLKSISLTHQPGFQHEYKFVDPGDTLYVEIGRNEDMGQWSNPYYLLKTNIPDGSYSIYINDTLAFEGMIYNHQPNDFWIYYMRGKIWYRTIYRDGKPLDQTYYYSSGKTWSQTIYKDGEWFSSTTYTENGDVENIRERTNGKIIY